MDQLLCYRRRNILIVGLVSIILDSYLRCEAVSGAEEDRDRRDTAYSLGGIVIGTISFEAVTLARGT